MRLLAGVVFRDGSPDPAIGATLAAGLRPVGEVQGVRSGTAMLLAAGSGVTISSDGTLVLMGDLDLLNWEALAAGSGERTPGEVLLALWRRHGVQTLGRLRGGFALAVWDAAADRLVLAVDRCGIKRLYHAETPTGTVWASRAALLTGVAAVGTEVDREALYCYLNIGAVPAPRSAYARVRRLPPGYFATGTAGRVSPSVYWDMSYTERPQSVAEASTRAEALLADAVTACARSAPEGVVGSFLSGGMDSSTITALLARTRAEPADAFSIGFAEARYNELPYAELVARHVGARHHRHILSADEALKALPDLVEAFDEPFGNSSMIPAYFCARLARERGVDCLLAGDGGDEIFGGNAWYASDRVFAAYRHIPRWVRRAVIEPTLAALPADAPWPLGRAQRYVRRAGLPTERRVHSYGFYVAQHASEVLVPDFLRAVSPEAPWRVVEGHFHRPTDTGELNRLLYLDLKVTIGDNDLLKVTRAAELAGIAVRFPMLDHPLMEFTGSLPSRLKVRGLETRYLFRRAFGPLLPPALLDKRKHGFGLPVGDWLRSHAGFRELARDTLSSGVTAAGGIVGAPAIQRLFDLHDQETEPYYGDHLWTFLMLELWHRSSTRARSAA